MTLCEFNMPSVEHVLPRQWYRNHWARGVPLSYFVVCCSCVVMETVDRLLHALRQFSQSECVAGAEGLCLWTFTHPPFPSLLLLTPVLFILVAFMHMYLYMYMYIYIYICVYVTLEYLYFTPFLFATSLDSRSAYLFALSSLLSNSVSSILP